MLEYEKKVLLTEKEYQLIKQSLGQNASTIIQTNYYFDTDEFSLNGHGITCRIRSKNGMFTSTIKSHGRNGNMENILEVRKDFNMDIFEKIGLHLQGSLITERTVIYRNECCEVVLDRNIYLNHTDYEVEIEYQNHCNQQAINWLYKMANILLLSGELEYTQEFFDRVGKAKSKSKRFFARRAAD